MSAMTVDAALAAAPRFRASERSRIRDSARHGMVLVVAAALLDCVWLPPFHPDDAVLAIGLNVAVALAGVLAYMGMRTSARRHSEGIAFAVLVVIDATTMALGLYIPELGFVAAGYLLLLPTVVALLLPWATRIHVTWLALHAAATLAYAAFVPDDSLPGGARVGMLGLLVVALTVSQFGHVSALRARILNFVQIGRIRALNRQARRDQARLDRLNSMLERTASTDELTALKNRLRLKSDLAMIRARIDRHGERYGLFMLDLDRFKAINDQRGHMAGDVVLRSIAGALMGEVRAEDGAFRYGGDEFIVLIQIQEPADALVAAERLRQAVEDLRIPHPDNAPYKWVTVSTGVAAIGREDLVADDDAWFARADAALYRAKANGRNRCETDMP